MQVQVLRNNQITFFNGDATIGTMTITPFDNGTFDFRYVSDPDTSVPVETVLKGWFLNYDLRLSSSEQLDKNTYVGTMTGRGKYVDLVPCDHDYSVMCDGRELYRLTPSVDVMYPGTYTLTEVQATEISRFDTDNTLMQCLVEHFGETIKLTDNRLYVELDVTQETMPVDARQLLISQGQWIECGWDSQNNKMSARGVTFSMREINSHKDIGICLQVHIDPRFRSVEDAHVQESYRQATGTSATLTLVKSEGLVRTYRVHNTQPYIDAIYDRELFDAQVLAGLRVTKSANHSITINVVQPSVAYTHQDARYVAMPIVIHHRRPERRTGYMNVNMPGVPTTVGYVTECGILILPFDKRLAPVELVGKSLVPFNIVLTALLENVDHWEPVVTDDMEERGLRAATGRFREAFDMHDGGGRERSLTRDDGDRRDRGISRRGMRQYGTRDRG